MKISELFKGQSRSIYVVGAIENLMYWMQGNSRPNPAILLSKIEWLANQPFSTLQHARMIWKLERGTSPPVYVIRKDQARLYCCLKGQDIVILCWAVKKQDKADPQNLRRAERLAREITNGE
jgi:hypothetical protein